MINPLDLHALADEQLDRNLAEQLREQLKQDPEAKAEYEAILNGKDFLRQRSMRYEAEECWKGCVKRLNEIDRTKKVESFVGRYAWAMCAILFALILGGRYAVKNVRGDTQQIADLRISLPWHHQAPALSPEQQQAYDEVLRIARAAVNPDKRLTVVRRGLWPFQDKIAARLDLFDPGHGAGSNLSLFVIPAPINFEDSVEIPTEPGMYSAVIPEGGRSANCVIWQSNGSTMVLAGNRSTEDLVNASKRLRNGAPH